MAITDSDITTEDTTIATTGRETLALNVTGLGTNEPADSVEVVKTGADELLSVGFTETKTHKLKLYVAQNLLTGTSLHLLKRQK